MDSKEEIFRALVKNDTPDDLENLWGKLDLFNRTQELDTRLQEQDIINILLRYLSGSISAQHVEDWANFLECTSFETGNIGTELIAEIIYELANPAVEGALTPEIAIKIIEQLRNR